MTSITREAAQMKMLKDCSEILEARELLLQIMAEPAPARAERLPLGPPRGVPAAPAPVAPSVALVPPRPEERSHAVAVEPEPSVQAEVGPPLVVAAAVALRPITEDPGVVAEVAPAPAPLVPPPADEDAGTGVANATPRGDQLQNLLTILCAREGLVGALVTDSSGLPVAASSTLEANENLAAYSTVLGDALQKAGSYLGQDEAREVSLDINSEQKVVLHRFDLEGRPFYLLVLCDPDTEPRLAMRGVVPEVLAILSVT